MEVHIFIKGNREKILFEGERIDVLDFEMNKIKYKQIRCFKKGISKSELIETSIIDKIIEKE